MRTIIVMTIVGLVVCGAVAAEEVTKEQGKDLLEKAGQDALSYYDEQLKKANDEVTTYMEEAGSDRVITGEEMVGLKERVKPLSKLKEEAIEHLRTYNLTIGSDLTIKIGLKEEIVFKYFRPLMRERDEDGEVRKLFAQTVGRDLKIEGRFLWFILAGCLAGIVACIGVMVILSQKEVEEGIFYLFPLLGMIACTIMIIGGLAGT